MALVNTPGGKFKWQRMLRLLAGALGALYVFSRFMPCASLDDYPVTDSLENAWTQALHVAHLNHFQFGTDLVFTYGPWGFLARGYHPETFWIAFAAWSGLTLVFTFASWRVACSMTANRVWAGGWLILFTALTTIPLGEDINTRMVALGLLLLCLHFFVEDKALTLPQALLAGALGWMSLVKFTGFAESILLLSVVAADIIFRRRRFPWIIVCWLAGVIFFWWLAGQRPGLLPAYFRNSWQITQGYTEAMMLSDRNELWRVAGFVLIALLECLLIARLAKARLHHFRFLPAAGVAMVLFIVFKLGYVRAGWQHECTSALALVLVALVCVGLKPDQGRRTRAAALGLLFAAGLFALAVFSRWFPGDGLGRQVAATFQPANLFAPIAVVSTDYLSGQHDKQLAENRKEFTPPPIAGTVDLYSYDQNILFAHGLRYWPRPVFQSYSAYTPELAAMNAAHLRSAAAATDILFAIQPVDGRFPALDDAPSWPELLSRYDVAEAGGKFLHLKRSAVPRPFAFVPLENLAGRLDENVRVPDAANGLVWVELEINQTPAGRVLSALYKPPPLSLIITMRNGGQKHFRLVPGMARGGFLLSPVVADNDAFAALATGGWRHKLAGQTVESITVSLAGRPGGIACYQSLMPVRFYRLEFPSSNYPGPVLGSPGMN